MSNIPQYTHQCTHTHVHTHTRTHTNTHVRTHINTHIRKHINTHIHTQQYTHIHAHAHSLTRTHTHTHTHTEPSQRSPRHSVLEWRGPAGVVHVHHTGRGESDQRCEGGLEGRYKVCTGRSTVCSATVQCTYSAVCSAVQGNARIVQYVVQYSAMRDTMQYSATVQCTIQYSNAHHSTLHYSDSAALHSMAQSKVHALIIFCFFV